MKNEEISDAARSFRKRVVLPIPFVRLTRSTVPNAEALRFSSG